MTQTNFDLKSYHPILATVYAEAKKHTPKEYDGLISDVLHKAESGKKEFGAETGSLSNVLQHNYKSAKKPSPKYLEAMNLNFKSHENEGQFKHIASRFSGIMRGTIPRTPFETAKPVGRKASGTKKIATMR